MLSTKELRVGNVVKSLDGNILTVYGLTGNNHEHGNIVWYDQELGFYLEENELQPILLTPEILEACGFEQEDWGTWGIEIYKGTKFYTGWFMIDRQVENEFSCTMGDYRNDTTAKIFHLHQLQNLYFMLTGKELEVNQLA